MDKTVEPQKGDGPARQVQIASFNSEPLARMWAETLRQESIPSLVKARGVGTAEWGSIATQPHFLYVLTSAEATARSIIPEEYQVWPAAGSRSRPGLNPRAIVYLIVLSLMGFLLWLALSQ